MWYPAYESTPRAWGLTPLEDQQLAGLIMWVPAGAVFVVVGLGFFAAWIRESERRVRAVSFLFFVSVVSFVSSVSCGGGAYREAAELTGGDPSRGKLAITKYGCDTCHTIPGVRTARALVGPPLTSVAARLYIAGHLPNTHPNMEQWIQHPRANEPHTVMPEMGVTEADARDIAAYLYTLR
jgi:cytochrome c2